MSISNLSDARRKRYKELVSELVNFCRDDRRWWDADGIQVYVTLLSEFELTDEQKTVLQSLNEQMDRFDIGLLEENPVSREMRIAIKKAFLIPHGQGEVIYAKNFDFRNKG